MDLHLGDAEPDAVEATAIASVGAAAAVAGRRDLVLPTLHAVADQVGWISPGAINGIAAHLHVPPAEVHGTASFYAHFSLQPRPRRVRHVCDDVVCLLAGARTSGEAPGQARGGPAEAVVAAPCLGRCETAPAELRIEGAGELDPAPPPAAAVPQAGHPGLSLLARVGRADPTDLDAYRALGGYRALRRALALGPAATVREVAESGLIGRGGAAFAAGRKWEAVATNPDRPHHLVCNADESEPGTFKDRVLIEGDPFAVIEAMTIAGYAIGCEHGYVYLRAEYPRARQTLQAAIESARRRGYLGLDVLGRGVAFDLEVRVGAGAYICGEETALFSSIEGYRGEPRNKPPYPVQVGLFGQPTLVHNVETLANVVPILANGAAAFAAVGTETSTGTKLLCLSGHVARPGVYEVPFGRTLGEVLDTAGGVAGGRPLQAVLLGGAAGGFATPADLDLPLTFEDTRRVGLGLGSGAVVVLDDTVEVGAVLERIAAFFRDESCGQCVPCRVGTVRQHEALVRLRAGGADSDPGAAMATIRDLGQVMRDASICGLGHTASAAIESAVDRLGTFRAGPGTPAGGAR